MSSELNKLFPSSSLKLQKVIMNILCFIDNKAVFSNKYSLSSNKLDIYQQSTENISLFYGFDTGMIYEYEAVLNNSGVIIEGEDKKGNILQNVNSDNILVFVNGILLNKDEFEILDNSSIALHTVIPQNLFQQILIYVFNNSLGYLSLSGERINKSEDPEDPIVHNHLIKTYYNINNSIIFINGTKVNSESIKQYGDLIGINIDIKNSDLIEIYTLDNRLKGLNFYTTFGYTTYGPLDSNDNPIPILYNCIATFDNITKLVIDNIRPGFFIKENIQNGGVAIVVDDNFETNNIKCLIEENHQFQKGSYFANEYYLEVPTGKNIVEYLSDYDKKFPMLPEILDVFHNVILKEIYDSIVRLRDIRNLSRVDSYHINKLIRLLGFDTPINHLTLKQKHALLEELNNYYRIVGTRDSYDMFNIIQDDIKIVDIEQLFTPHINEIIDEPIDVNGHYVYTISNNPELADWKKYYAGNRVYFNIEDDNNPGVMIPFTFTVTEVNPVTGEIISVDPDRVDGIDYEDLRNTHYFKPVDLDLSATITTVNNLYNHAYTVTNSRGFEDSGIILVSEDNEYSLEVTKVEDGVITEWKMIKGPESGSIDLTQSGIPLRRKTTSDISLNVTSTVIDEQEILNTRESGAKNIVLEPGYYRYDISGGGGGGASADSGQGSESDLYADTGEAATRLQGTFQVTVPSTLEYIVGTGGQPAYARWYKWSANNGIVGTPGVGFENGKPGIAKAFNESGYSHWGRWCVSGSGGGSTRIFVNHIKEAIAPGGRGGKVHDNLTPGDGGSYSLPGKNNGGAAGGRGTNPDGNHGHSSWGKFWSWPGDNGWIKIYKQTCQYTTTITGDESSVHIGDEFATINNEFNVKKTNSGYNITPQTGIFYYNTTFPLVFINDNKTAKLKIVSTLVGSEYNISTPYGNSTPYLFAGADLVATLSDEAKEQFPDYADFSVNGQVRYFNKATNQAMVYWDWSSTDYNVKNFSNTSLVLTVKCGNGATCSTSFVTYETKKGIQEYVDFFTKEELGAEHIKKYIKNSTDYGSITEGTPNSPRPYQVGEPDYDYGETINGTEEYSENYGSITEFTGGEYVDYWLWDRDPKYYPTNHVNVEIKIEASDYQEEIINRFYRQFYDLASTVLYIHRLTCSYFFGNTTENVSTGIVSPETSPIFFGIKTGQPVSYEVYTMTSDPARQISDENIIY